MRFPLFITFLVLPKPKHRRIHMKEFYQKAKKIGTKAEHNIIGASVWFVINLPQSVVCSNHFACSVAVVFWFDCDLCSKCHYHYHYIVSFVSMVVKPWIFPFQYIFFRLFVFLNLMLLFCGLPLHIIFVFVLIL